MDGGLVTDYHVRMLEDGSRFRNSFAYSDSVHRNQVKSARTTQLGAPCHGGSMDDARLLQLTYVIPQVWNMQNWARDHLW